MAVWQDLPLEIITEILSQLPSPLFLKATSLVCSHLKEPSQTLLNRAVSIRTSAEWIPNDFQRRDFNEVSASIGLSMAVGIHVPREGIEYVFEARLIAFVNFMLASPSLFRLTRKVSFGFGNELKPDGRKKKHWIGKEDWDVKENRFRVVQRPPVQDDEIRRAVGERLKRAASKFGISAELVHARPASAALLVLFHSLRNLNSVRIEEGESLAAFPTLLKATCGQLPGGLPKCFRAVESLELEDHHHKYFLPSVAVFPRIRRLTCSKWHSEVGTLPFELGPGTPLPTASRLTRLKITESLVCTEDVIVLLRLAVNLESFEYKFVYNPDDPPDPFDCAAFVKALERHSKTLRVLRIWWELEKWGPDTLSDLLEADGEMGPLSGFTSLVELAIPPEFLFGWPSHVFHLIVREEWDPKTILPTYLPPSLETLEFYFLENWTLGDLKDVLELHKVWADVKTPSFPNLKSFTVVHQDKEFAESFVRNRVDCDDFQDDMEKIGIIITPPVYRHDFSSRDILGFELPSWRDELRPLDSGRWDEHQVEDEDDEDDEDSEDDEEDHDDLDDYEVTAEDLEV